MLPTTLVNISRERACFTDFPFPGGTSSYPNSSEVDKYLNDYADAFNLRPRLRLGTAVQSITRNDSENTWTVTLHARGSSQTENLNFDKLVMTIGPHSKPIYPQIANQEAFKGEIVHSIAFKDPFLLTDKRVLVIGASNTAADTCTSLIGIASEIYMSHRHGTVIVPRLMKDGTSLDHGASYRTFALTHALDAYLPNQARKFLDGFVAKIMTREFGSLDLAHQNPIVTDTFIPALRAGTIISHAAPVRIIDEQTIELQDGTTVQADAIICCTGYSLDLSMLGPYDPTATRTRSGVSQTQTQTSLDTPALYQNIFSLEYPDSLAFIGIAITFNPAFVIADLSSMALAQLWSGKPSSPNLPPMSEMQRWYDAHLSWVAGVRRKSMHGKCVKLMVRNGPWLAWVDEVAGTNVERYLSYLSLEAWKFWWKDREFCGLLSGRILSPHIYRVFGGGRRKRWDGARDAIVRVNEGVKENMRRRKEMQVEGVT